ncbi:MAG: hypothetical protein K6E40_12745 [Desulfovibrio sp.]|nr:hypothetical protein [Desulfovibrio sp.]
MRANSCVLLPRQSGGPPSLGSSGPSRHRRPSRRGLRARRLWLAGLEGTFACAYIGSAATAQASKAALAPAEAKTTECASVARPVA